MGNCNFSSNKKDTEELISAKAFAVTSLNEIAIFSRLKEEDLTDIQETLYSPGEDIIVQGDDQTDLIYVLRSGVCDVKVNGKVVNTLKRASVIGERAFIAQTTRSATVSATEQCSVLAIQRSSLERSLGFDNFNAAEMSDEEIKAEKLKRLSQFPLLSMLSEDYMKDLAKDMLIKQYLPGEPIILKGTIGTEFYFIDRGSVDVVADNQSFENMSAGSDLAASPSSVSLSLRSDSVDITGSSPKLLIEKTPGSAPRTPGDGVSCTPRSENINPNRETPRGVDLSKPIEGKRSPLQGVPLVRLAPEVEEENQAELEKENEGEEGEKADECGVAASTSPLHPDSEDHADVINRGVNDFLENYENVRIKNLGGVLRDLKKNGFSPKNKQARSRRVKKSVNINVDDVKATLRAGQFFGEMALMEGENGRRTATCLARTHTTLLAMKRESFLRLMDILQGN